MQLHNHEILLIGISGKKRHGKDSFAKFVRNEFDGSIHVSTRPFAAALKEECAEFVARELRPFWLPQMGECDMTEPHEVLADMVADDPERKEPYRLLLQWWGTEFRRNMCAEGYWLVQHERWVNAFAGRTPGDAPLVVLVPDVRFANEKSYIQSRGGVVVRVIRGSMEEGDPHPSETALDDCLTFDYWVRNDHSLHHLAAKAVDFCQWLKKEYPWIGQ
jgi:hypothetical protein